MENKSVIVKTRKQWRNWLSKNHDKEKKVSLVSYKKHTGVPSINHRESMDEAICFGWIDTTIKRLDEEKFQRTFVKRKSNANWSKNTLSYAEKLIEEKKMMPAGLKAYELGKKKLPHDHDANYEIPKELEKLFAKNKRAEKDYQNLTPSYRKGINRWINRAKLKETKEKRINIFLDKLKKGGKI